MKIPTLLLIFLAFFTPAILAAENEASGLDFADGLYSRKMYASAVPEYEKFIHQNPASPEAASARFRASDSRYFMKNYRGAAAGFGYFVRRFPSDKRVMLARFREGASRYRLKEYPSAEALFLKIIKGSDEPALKSGALFYLSKTMEARGLAGRSRELLQKLIRLYPGTDYASYAGLIIGEDLLKDQKPEEALRVLGVVAENKAAPDAAAQASLRIGDTYLNAKDPASAKGAYQKAFDLASSDEDKGKALLDLFRCDSQLHDLASFKKRLEETRVLVQSTGHEPEVHYLLSDVLADQDPAAAIGSLDAVLADASAAPELKQKASIKKAGILSSAGKNDEALKELTAVANDGSKGGLKAHLEMAEILRKVGRDREALEHYETVMKRPEADLAGIAQYQAGLVHLKLGKTDAAERIFSDYAKTRASDENAPKALLQVAQIHLDAGDFSVAAQTAKKVADAYPKSAAQVIAYYKLGVAETGLKRYREAADAFSQVINQGRGTPLYADALYGAAMCLENAGEGDAALSRYETLVHEFPEHALSLQATPHVAFLYLNAGLLDKLTIFYEDAILNRPSAPIDMDAVFWLIQHLIDKSRYEELQRVLDALPKRFPGEDLAHEIAFFNGESELGLKHYEDAAVFYSRAIQAQKTGPYAAHAHLGLGVAEAALGRAEQAEREFSEALGFEGKTQVGMRARFEIANLRLKAGRLQESAKAFMLVAIFYDDPKFVPAALYKAGECFLSLKKPEEAAQAFQELERRYPQSDWAKKIKGKAS